MWNLEKLQNNHNRHLELVSLSQTWVYWTWKGKHNEWNCPLSRHHINHGVSYFMTEGPSKEHGTNKPPPTRRVRGRSKSNTRCSFSLASVLAEQCVRHQEGPWVRVIGKRKPGNQSHHHKTQDCEPQGRAVLLGSLTWLFSAWAPFPSRVLLCQTLCFRRQFNSECYTRAHSRALEGVPLPATDLSG